MLYHATYTLYLGSILKKGLIPNYRDNWGGLSKEQKGVYLTNDIDAAISFIEVADGVSDAAYGSGGVVLGIRLEDLDINLLREDSNWLEDDIESYVYNGIITNFKIIEKDIEL